MTWLRLAGYRMGTWALLLLVTATWLLWAAGAVQAHHIGKREGRIRPEANMSVVPIIPLFPLAAFGIAKAVDLIVPVWGTWLVGGFHALLAAGFVGAIVWQTVRPKRKAPAA